MPNFHPPPEVRGRGKHFDAQHMMLLFLSMEHMPFVTLLEGQSVVQARLESSPSRLLSVPATRDLPLMLTL